ncbi:MAG: Uma2 family endonuclease [Thermomicrobiales bacterium]
MALQRIEPPPGTWTWEDLRALPDDGVRREIIAGELFEMTGPSAEHALAIANLIELLLAAFTAARMRWFTAPLDVFFPNASPVQPDLFALARDGAWSRSERGIEGAPAFIVEVLSPATRGRDLLTKRSLYQLAGVREYWLADPAARTVEVLALDGETFVTLCRAGGDEPVCSRLFPEVAFPASAVFSDAS